MSGSTVLFRIFYGILSVKSDSPLNLSKLFLDVKLLPTDHTQANKAMFNQCQQHYPYGTYFSRS